MITSRQKTFLTHASYKELLTLWRFEPNGSEWFSNDILTTEFHAAFDRERNLLTIPEQVAISKEIGFKSLPVRGSYDQPSEK